MPRRFGFGLGFSLSRLSGIPREPSGFVAKYTAYLVSNFTLVTGSNVSQWDDESVNANNLTQATSANQPTFNESQVVRQSTLANQPTLVDTGGGVLAVDFATNDYMLGLPVQSNDFTYVIKTETNADYELLNLNGVSGASDRLSVVNTQMYVKSSTSGTFFDFPSSIFGNKVYIIKKEGSLLRAYVDGVESTTGAVNIGTETFTVEGLSSVNYPSGSLSYIKIYSEAVADVTNIVETPAFELLADTQYIPSGVGQPVPEWFGTSYNQYANTVNFDATDDNMTPLPTTTGDFAMQFKKQANTLATTKVLFSSSTTSAEVRLNTSNQFEVVSDAGTVFTFTTTLVASQQEVNIIQRSGNNLEVYNSVGVKQVIDVTGEAFTFDRISDTTNASDSDWQEIRIYDEILDQASIDYFYYLRNANNEILLPLLLPS